jgi:hypothetical protein
MPWHPSNHAEKSTKTVMHSPAKKRDISNLGTVATGAAATGLRLVTATARPLHAVICLLLKAWVVSS